MWLFTWLDCIKAPRVFFLKHEVAAVGLGVLTCVECSQYVMVNSHFFNRGDHLVLPKMWNTFVFERPTWPSESQVSWLALCFEGFFRRRTFQRTGRGVWWNVGLVGVLLVCVFRRALTMENDQLVRLSLSVCSRICLCVFRTQTKHDLPTETHFNSTCFNV